MKHCLTVNTTFVEWKKKETKNAVNILTIERTPFCQVMKRRTASVHSFLRSVSLYFLFYFKIRHYSTAFREVKQAFICCRCHQQSTVPVVVTSFWVYRRLSLRLPSIFILVRQRTVYRSILYIYKRVQKKTTNRWCLYLLTLFLSLNSFPIDGLH